MNPGESEVPGRMKSQHGVFGDANTIARNGAQQRGARRRAGTVNHDMLPRHPDGAVLPQVAIDLAAAVVVNV